MIGVGEVHCYEREGGRVFAYITEEGAYVQKRGGNFVIGRNNECVMEIPEEVLEALTLIDSVQVSSQAMVELLRLGVPVTWLSRSGYFFGRLESTRHVNVFRQERQVLMKGSGFYLRMGRKVIAAKVHNQLTLHTAVMAELESIADIRQLRNEAAHEIVNVTEARFRQKVGMGSQEAVSCFCRMLALVYGDKVRAMRSAYRDLNAWIGQALEVHA